MNKSVLELSDYGIPFLFGDSECRFLMRLLCKRETDGDESMRNVLKNGFGTCVYDFLFVSLQPLSEQALVKKQVERLAGVVKCSRLPDKYYKTKS